MCTKINKKTDSIEVVNTKQDLADDRKQPWTFYVYFEFQNNPIIAFDIYHVNY